MAVIAGIVWAYISISQKIRGDRHQRKARELASTGYWEQASLSYKLAIVSRLDSEEKLRELIQELSDLYKSHGIEADLSHLHEYQQMLKKLEAITGHQKKQSELIVKLYKETLDFLDNLPGPEIPK